MLIVNLEALENGARENQVIYPALDSAPEGWAVVPPELEAQAIGLLPWLTLELRDGAIVGVGDNETARRAAMLRAQENRAAAGADPAQNPDNQ